jgi:type III restriction enzyme
VKQKRLATVEWVNKVNDLKPENRMNCTWSYVLLGENTFYEFQDKGASTEEILEYAMMTKAKIEGTLEDYILV